MTSADIRKRFLDFFEKRGHAILPSASLVPENDPSVLFNTAGMQPLVPYLLGEQHPKGDKLADIQKCVRTGDLDDIGDNRHLSFFEMMGNWSLGAYFKEDAIKWSYEFLTSKEEGLGLDVSRLYVTVFEGDVNAPEDTESQDIWKSLGIPEHRIYKLGVEDNWWSPGENGPCGPDTEMFYDMTDTGIGDLSKENFIEACKDETIIEIWNDVFMEYEKKEGKVIGKLAQKNVDTGAGLERITAVMQGVKTAYETDLFTAIKGKIDEFSNIDNIRARRIVADHIRTSVFLIADGVVPSNTDQGYVLRRLLRRAVRFADVLGMKHGSLFHLANTVIETYKEIYSNILTNCSIVLDEIEKEESKFRQTLERGMKEFEKGTDAFILATSYGFPIELTEELAKEKGVTIDRATFDAQMKEHQALSRAGAEQKFKGGLADHSEMSTKYHTATHLLQQALRDVLGNHVFQKGSNITPERMRFDFSHGDKMTDEQLKTVETIVNEKIADALPVSFEEVSVEEAHNRGALGVFDDRYGEKVKVYKMGDGDDKYSLEICGGPHVGNTKELGHFKIVKEEAVSQGVRRIKAVLE